ncbi:MAG: error-prone DNA polymerase [Bdellovibrio sp.]|nr:error-prone DNA polymerase [Bdellovibrio sp.]
MYVELNCRTNFSFLRGASDSREYIMRAAELGMPAVGVTDINGVYGLPRAYEAIRDHAPHLKLICGAEITIKEAPSITLIARTRRSWGLLCRIITQVHAGKLKGEGFITYEELQQITSMHIGTPELTCILKNDEKNNFDLLKSIFKNQIYLSLCMYLDGRDRQRSTLARSLTEKYKLPLVASNDVHYHEPSRQYLQDCLTCIREGRTLDTAGFKLFGNAERYLKSPMQMELLFAEFPDAISNTLKIASECNFSLSELKYTYPKEAVPAGHTAKSFLRELVMTGAKERYRGQLSYEVDKQIRKELDFFAKRGEEDYFLTMHDILKDARDRKIVFQGRGSAASSIVCYALSITAVDPIASQLLFDRFANDARKDPPDIDVDFEHERREEVIQGIYSRYGRDRAGMVAAVHTYKEKGAYREICKAIGVEVGTLKADVVRARFQELAKQYANREIFLENLTSQIADFPRHIGTHSGGFVITNEPLVETVPIEPAAMDGRTIVQWDKHDLETLGMMKIDILSIGFLTAIRKATDLVGIDWKDIPINDAKTYRLIQQAETAGCFQIESRAQMNSLPHTKPSTPYEMTIQVALIRPSMSKGGMSKSYLHGRNEARHGRPFKSGNLAMDKILSRTHGVAMFPDQIMQIAMDVCGFSAAGADQLRRSLGKERSASSVESQGTILFKALIENGISNELATDIVNRTQGFASYGFPEAHAASYGSLAFKSAYLKAHYPAEYLCALINSQPMGFYRIDFLICEAVRNSGVKMLPVHPNKSTWDATMEGHKTIRMGFRDVRRAREEDVIELVQQRNKKLFSSIEDFIARTDFDKSVLNNLTIANAFECFGIDRRHSFWKSIEFKNLMGKKTDELQLSLFDENLKMEDDPITFSKMTELEEALIDYRTVGYSLKGSLMKQLRIEVPHLPGTNSNQLKKIQRNLTVRCAGILLVDQRPPPAKGFGFITLEDEFGTIDLVLRPAIYDQYKSVFRSSRFLLITGKLQRLDDHVTILAETIESFAPHEKLRSHQPTPRMLDRLDW